MRIIHAPSGTKDVYAGTPQRKRMTMARKATPAAPIAKWRYLEEGKEGKLPIDDVTDPATIRWWGKVRRYHRQNALLEIAGPDGVSDSGEEIYNFFEQQGIRNVAPMGVPLTDAMYDPRQKPYVSHAAGTEPMVRHVEKHWRPSILGQDLTRLAGAASD